MKLKRILAVILALCMVFSTMSFGAFAEGEGTDPVQDFVITMYYEMGFTATYTYEAGTEGNLAECIDDVFDDNFDGGLMGSIASIEIDINADMEITDPIVIPAGKTAVLDLNGHTMSYSTDVAGVAMITNKGDLTINGNGAIEYTYTGAVDGGKAANAIRNEGKLIIDGPAISNTTTTSTQIGYAVDNYAGAELTVKDGSLTVEGSVYYDAIRLFCNSDTANNVVVIEGGNVGTVWMQNPSDGSDSRNTKDTVLGSLTIKGGTVGKVYLEPCAAFDVAVEGGTIAGVYSNDTANSTSTSVPTGFITGGTISSLGDDLFLADGFELDESGSVVESTPAVTAVATVNGVEYKTFSEALTAANALTGDVVVEIFDKVTLNQSLTGSYNSIKFVGKDTDAEIYLEVQGYITAGGKDVYFEDLTLSKSEGTYMTNAGFMNVAFGVYDVESVTYTNCTFANGAYASSGKNTFTDCTFYRSYDKYGLWAYGSDDIVVDGCTFADYRGIKMYDENKGANNTTVLTVKNTDFSAVTAKPAIVLTYGESVTLENNTYSSTGVFELDLDGAPNGTTVTSDVAPTCVNDNGNCGVLVDGKIYTTVGDAVAVAEAGDTVTLLYSTEETATFAEGVTLELADGVVAENVTVAAPAYVATVNGTKYATLAEAATAAVSGDEIVVLIDVTEDVTVPAGIIFNGNGKQVGAITAAGEITFKGHTKATNFSVEYANTTINIGEGACLEITGTGRMVIGHGCTFNITGSITDAKTANTEELTPSLIMPGASFTGAGVTFNATNAYIKTTASYCSSSKSASGTFDFNIENSIWEQFGKLAFEAQSTAATVNFDLKDSVLTTTSHLIFGVSKGEIVIDNSNVNVGTSKQIENRSTMTIKNGSVVNGAVAISSNAINPGTLIIENATYSVTGEYSGASEGTGTIVIKDGASFTAGKITNANIQIDATNMSIGEEINLTADLSGLTGTVEVINNGKLGASIVDNKIVLSEKPVAKVGETTYTSLDEAIAAANAGDTVTIFEGTYALPAMKAGITIVGEGVVLLEGTLKDTLENLTLKNLHIKGGNAQRWAYAKGDLVFENVTFEATSVYALHFDGITEGATLLYKDCTIIGWAAMSGSPASAVFDGCTFKDNGTYGVIRTYFDAEIKNCTFDVDGANTGDVYQDGIHAVGATVKVENTTNANGDIKDILNISGESEIYVDGTLVLYPVAKIGDDYYSSLADAFDGAKDGETITLLADVEITESLKVEGKSIVLDLNGKTITGTDNTTKNYGLIDIYPGAQLTVNDAVGTGKITLTATNNRGWGSYSAVIANQRGKLTVNGGTIEHLGGTDMAYGIDNLTNGKGTYAETVINDGTVKSTYRAIRQFLNGTEAQNILTVNGGTIEGANKSIWMQDTNKSANTGSLTVSENAVINGDINLTVTAGSTEWPVEVAIAAEALKGESTVLTSNVPAHLELRFENGVYGVAEKNFAEVDGVKFTTLQAAIDAAGAGDVVTLLSDIELSESVTIPSGANIVLDLNGKTISMTDASGKAASAIKNNGTLTIKDSAENGKITFVSSTPSASFGYSTSTVVNSGNLVVNGGTVENTTNGGASYAIDTAWYSNDISVTINGGTIKSAKTAIRQVPFSATAKNVLTVNGGTIEGGYAAVQTHSYSSADAIAEVNINGGTLSGDYAYYTYYSHATGHAGTDIEITDGTFNGYVYIYNGNAGSAETDFAKVSVSGGTFNGGVYVYTKDAESNAAAIGAITGGTFDTDVSEYLAEGYSLYTNANDPSLYSVSETRSIILNAPEEVNTGETFDVEVFIDTDDIKSVKWTLDYDINYFTLVSTTIGRNVSGNYQNYAANEAPEIMCESGVIDTASYVVKYTFTATKYATTGSTITLKDVVMQNATESIEEINVSVDDASVTIKTTIDYVVEVGLEEDLDYVAGTKLVLVYSNAEGVTFDFNGVQMFDVTGAGYKYEGQKEYAHVYALVVEALSEHTLDAYEAKVTVDYTGTAPTVTYDKNYEYLAKMHDNDVNISGTVNWNDIISVYAVAERNEYAFRDAMNVVLKADVNGDKVVDTQDASPIINQVYDR